MSLTSHEAVGRDDDADGRGDDADDERHGQGRDEDFTKHVGLLVRARDLHAGDRLRQEVELVAVLVHLRLVEVLDDVGGPVVQVDVVLLVLLSRELADDFELVLANKEWLDEEKVTAFMRRFREELGLEGLSSLKKFKYTCEKSRGYFLKGRSYEVWSQLVGRPERSLELTKKVLIVDLHCGVPCVVDYAEENFSPIE